MSDVGLRIKELRQALNVNQTEFAKKLNMKQSVIGMYERELRNVPDRTMFQIVQMYNVNYEWLKTGEGEMFNEADDDIIKQLAAKYRLSVSQTAIIRAYLNLSEDHRQIILDFILNLADEIRKDEETLADKECLTDNERIAAHAHKLLDEFLGSQGRAR